MDNVKTRTSAKADRKGLKRRAGDDPFVPYAAVDETSVPATSGDHSTPMETGETGRDASASSSTTRVPMEVDSAAAKGPSTTDGATPIPREFANDILAAIPLLPDEWPLAKIDLILQNMDKYYMSWRRFLFVHELLRAFDEESAVAAVRANTTSLVEHLVEFLSEWIVTFVEPAREITKVRDPELLFLHEKDYTGSGPSGKTFTLRRPWTESKAATALLLDWSDVFARTIAPKARRIQGHGHR